MTLPVGIRLLFFYVGLLCERVGEKTYKIGGKLFKIAGTIAFIWYILLKYALFFIPVILVAIYIFEY
ncbi:MAG: hypothetical protein QME61_03870 [Patescibacteria group bacterium]|nr:hypothetical protein [Patescibacteria group bacterium]